MVMGVNCSFHVRYKIVRPPACIKRLRLTDHYVRVCHCKSKIGRNLSFIVKYNKHIVKILAQRVIYTCQFGSSNLEQL